MTQGAGVFVHGMRRFTSVEVLKVLSERPVITTLCAPPTLYRQEQNTGWILVILIYLVGSSRLGPGLGLTHVWIVPRPVGRSCSYILPEQDGGTSHI